jgi:hypothetical protein
MKRNELKDLADSWSWTRKVCKWILGFQCRFQMLQVSFLVWLKAQFTWENYQISAQTLSQDHEIHMFCLSFSTKLETCIHHSNGKQTFHAERNFKRHSKEEECQLFTFRHLEKHSTDTNVTIKKPFVWPLCSRLGLRQPQASTDKHLSQANR